MIDDVRGPRLPPAVLVAGLSGLALWLRVGPFNPPSLWLDDLWVITPSRAGSLGDALEMMVTAPGFSALVNALPWLFGPEAWAAQMVPLVAGVAAPAATWVTCRRMGWGGPAAVVAATVMATAPEHILYSTRVKQYTLEAAAGLVVVVLAWGVLERRSSAWSLAMVAIGTTVLSGSAGVFAGAVVVTACALAIRGGRERLTEVIKPAATYGVATGLWWVLYLRTRVPDGLKTFWEPNFITIDAGPRELLIDLRDSVDRTANGFLPLSPAWALLVVAGVILYVTNPRLALLLSAPLLAAVALALLQQAPLGTGRTEIYLLPVAALALGGALEGISARLASVAPRAGGVLAVGFCAALVVAVVARDVRSEPYPNEDVRAFIEATDLDLRQGKLVLVYPATRWAYAVYSGGRVEPQRVEASPTGFEPEITTPGVRVLRPHRDDPERYGHDIALAVAGAHRVVFIASHWRGDVDAIEAWFPANGWTEVRRDVSKGGRRVEFAKQ